MKTLTVTKESFEREVLNTEGLAIVDFWAPWCGPCKIIAPLMDEIATQYAGIVKVTKLNVDEDAATAQRFSITSIPTLIFFRNGTIVDRITGAVSRNQLDGRIRSLLEVPVTAN
jgi:thioredoxin